VHAIAVLLGARRDLRANQAEAHVLAHLHAVREATIAALHAEFGHRRSTLTSILERLEARGLVTRETDTHDRRSVNVRLTRSGSALAAKIYDVLSEHETRALSRFSAKELALFARMLAALSSSGEGESP